MGRFPEGPSRARILFALGLLSLVAYTFLSLHFVGSGEAGAILDCRPLFAEPRLLPSGWHVAPPAFCRLIRIPSSPRDLIFDLPQSGDSPMVSREGVPTRIRGTVSFQVPGSSALNLYRLASGASPNAFLLRLTAKALSGEVREESFARISGAHRVDLEAALDRILGQQLRDVGVVLHHVEVQSVRMARPGAASSPAPLPDSKLLVLGLDGADWRVMDPLLRAGRLPNLARLMAEGIHARLRTLDPILSPVIWTSAATGFLPSEHGILDFLVHDTRTGREVPVTSRHRKVKAIWNLLSDSGVSVGIIGWWATWPSEYVDGYIVSDRVAYQLFGQRMGGEGGTAGKTFPPDLYSRIQPLIQSPEQVSEDEINKYLRNFDSADRRINESDRSREKELRTVLASTDTYASIAQVLGSKGYQPFEAIYFEGIDTVSHLFMPFRPPQREGIGDSQFERYSGAVDSFYENQDRIIGELLSKADPDTGVVVVSDHGFKSDNDRPHRESRINYASAASWHRKYGIFIAAHGRFAKGKELSEISILDLTPTILAYFGLPVGEDMQGRPVPDLFDPEFLRQHPVTYRPSWESSAATSRAPLPSDPQGDQALREKLRSLGYLSQGGDLTSNNLGNTLLAQGKVEQAIPEFQKAVSNSPNLALAHVNLARAYLLHEEMERAKQEAAQALRLDPVMSEASILLAQIALREGDAAGAQRRLRGVLDREPSSGAAHTMLGEILHFRGEDRLAEAEYESALKIDPEDAQAQNSFGVLLRDSGRLEEAGQRFKKAVDADPSFTPALSNLATSAMERGDLEEAQTLLDRAVHLSPADSAIHNNRGNLLLRKGKLEEAANEFRSAIHTSPGYAEPHNGLGAMLVQKGRLGEAEEEFRKAISLDSKSSEATLNLARILIQQSRGEQARELLREFLRRVPGEKEISLELAKSLLQSGKGEEAEAVCRAALSLHPEDFSLWNLQGDSALAAGKSGAALKAFRRSLELNSLQPEVEAKLRRMEAPGQP